MATYPQTGSILNSSLHTALSTQITIMVNNEPVGAIQSFSISQSRNNKRLGEVGLDGTLELVPSTKADVTLNIKRAAYDGLNISESFSRGYVNVQSQRIAFDIVEINQFSGTGDDSIITTYKNCWFKSISKSYSSDDYIIMEDCVIDVEDVFSIRGGEALALSQGVGGGRQLGGIQIDGIELQADSGIRRGTLDFAGLISASF